MESGLNSWPTQQYLGKVCATERRATLVEHTADAINRSSRVAITRSGGTARHSALGTLSLPVFAVGFFCAVLSCCPAGPVQPLVPRPLVPVAVPVSHFCPQPPPLAVSTSLLPNTAMDYEGQKLSELLFHIIILTFGGVGWVVGYFAQNFTYVFYAWAIGTALSVVVSSVLERGSLVVRWWCA